jgi:hypothetical protein
VRPDDKERADVSAMARSKDQTGAGDTTSAHARLLQGAEQTLVATLHTLAADAAVDESVRAAVCEYVSVLRNAGELPESVVVSFKRVISRPGRATARSDEFMCALVSACIDMYFAPK